MSERLPSTRRPFRFSLRAVLILVAVVALVMGWVHDVRERHATAMRVRTSNPGAVLLHDHQVTREGHVQPTPAWWNWDEYLADVAGADLSYPTDEELKTLSRLTSLRRLYLARAVDVTDAGLAHLERLTRLRLLVLGDADQVTDAGLRSLGRLKSLTFLKLDLGRRMTPAGIEQLKRDLPHCRIEIDDDASGDDLAVMEWGNQE
jgi:hypothetical protein